MINTKLKRVYLLFIIFAVVLFTLTSCFNGFVKDPRLYNKTTEKRNSAITTEDPPVIEVGISPFDDNTAWFNNPDTNGDGTAEELGFSATEFDSLLLTAWFDKVNVAYYSLNQGASWKSSNIETAEFSTSGPNTEGQGYTINGVTYYLYKGIHPSYDAEGSYNTVLSKTQGDNPRLNRFYFYRFTGKGGGIQWLDNYLIAIDTYSKLIFAFAKPVEFSNMGAPTKWLPTDASPYTDGNSYKFYEYDPVGYVKKNADNSYTVELYQWFKTALGSGKYDPQMNGGGDVRKVPEGAGKSPFNALAGELFVANMKNVATKGVFKRRSTDDGGKFLYTYTISSDGKTISRTEQEYNKAVSSETKIFTYVSHSSATEGIFSLNGIEYNFNLTDETRSIVFTNEGTSVKAVRNFVDPGPEWLIRVAGKTFRYDDYDNNSTYTFSEDGRSFVTEGKTYTFVQQDDNQRAVYKTGGAYYGMRLDSNDSKLYWSQTSWAGASTTPTNGVTSYPSSWIKEVTESFRLNVMNGIYSYRNGLMLYSIEFDGSGEKATFKETKWRENSTEKEVVNFTSEVGKTTATFGSKQFTLSADLRTLTCDGKEYILNFVDPGPEWLLRVAGKTFRYDDNNSTYTFSEDGRSFKDGSKTYTFVQQHDNQRAVYKTGISHWGMRLDSNDSKLYWSGSSWAGASTTPTNGVTSYPSTLVE